MVVPPLRGEGDLKVTWDDVLERIKAAGLQPTEEIYIDNYGNVLPLEHPEFQGRFFRCARGVLTCRGLRIEAFLFPSEAHLRDFIEVIGDDPWWIVHENLVIHFPESDPAVIGSILEAIAGTRR
jgi:hypothetical protein